MLSWEIISSVRTAANYSSCPRGLASLPLRPPQPRGCRHLAVVAAGSGEAGRGCSDPRASRGRGVPAGFAGSGRGHRGRKERGCISCCSHRCLAEHERKQPCWPRRGGESPLASAHAGLEGWEWGARGGSCRRGDRARCFKQTSSPASRLETLRAAPRSRESLSPL